MADNILEEMLAINKSFENNPNPTQHQQHIRQAAMEQMMENQSYEPVMMQEERPKYDPKQEMEQLKALYEGGGLQNHDFSDSKIPKNILNEILNNPLNMPVIEPKEDPKVNELMGRVQERFKKNAGIKNTVSLMNEMERRPEKQMLQETTPRQQMTTGSEDIRQIISEVLDEKLGAYLNESRQMNNVAPIKFLNFSDKFYFVDNDNNVYECVMKYKGKNKKR